MNVRQALHATSSLPPLNVNATPSHSAQNHAEAQCVSPLPDSSAQSDYRAFVRSMSQFAADDLAHSVIICDCLHCFGLPPIGWQIIGELRAFTDAFLVLDLVTVLRFGVETPDQRAARYFSQATEC